MDCRPLAHRALVGFLSRVDPHVDEEFVAGVERLALSRAHMPHAREVVHLPLLYVGVLYVLHYFIEVHELLPATIPHADPGLEDFFLDSRRARVGVVVVVVVGGGRFHREVVMMMMRVIGRTPALGVRPVLHEVVLGCSAYSSICDLGRVVGGLGHPTGGDRGGKLGVYRRFTERDLVWNRHIFVAVGAVIVLHGYPPVVDSP